MRHTRLLRSSSFRLAVGYMALFGSSVLILLGFLYWATAGYMARQTEATIEAEVQGLAEHYRRFGIAALSSVVSERIQRDPTGASIYLLTDPSFVPLLGNLAVWPRAENPGRNWIEFQIPGGDGEGSRPARARQFQLRGGFQLLVGRDVSELAALESLIQRALVGGLAVTVLLALIGGSTMGWSVLRRIESINETSRDIMAGNLSKRIPTQGSGDDFDQLADNLNAMLNRIQALMEEVRRVSDNIAHDLRTPLARLRARLETLSGRLEGDDEPAVQAAIDEADALLATFNALLRIARVESGENRRGFGPVNLKEIVRDVADLYEPVAEHKQQRLRVTAPADAWVWGDRNLLFQAAANVLDNAIKYTPAGGEVNMDLVAAESRIRLEISDTGPGIPEVFRDRVFERFFRIESARTTPGNGLGLSLVAAVAHLHEAQMTLAGNKVGLRFTLSLASIPEPDRIGPAPASPDRARSGVALDSGRPASRDAHLGNRGRDGGERLAHLLLPEVTDAAHPEAVGHRQLSGIDHEPPLTQRVVEGVEIPPRVAWHAKGDDDRRLQLVGQQRLEPEPPHSRD